MAKQEKSVHKKRGRPAGRSYGETIPMRLSPALKDKVEAWAEKQPDGPSRSEALRRLYTPPGDTTAARIIFERLVEKYPGTPAAQAAEKKLKQLQ